MALLGGGLTAVGQAKDSAIATIGGAKDELAQHAQDLLNGATTAAGTAGDELSQHAQALLSGVPTPQAAQSPAPPSPDTSATPPPPPSNPLEDVKQKFGDALDALGTALSGAMPKLSNDGPGLQSATGGLPAAPQMADPRTAQLEGAAGQAVAPDIRAAADTVGRAKDWATSPFSGASAQFPTGGPLAGPGVGTGRKVAGFEQLATTNPRYAALQAQRDALYAAQPPNAAALGTPEVVARAAQIRDVEDQMRQIASQADIPTLAQQNPNIGTYEMKGGLLQAAVAAPLVAGGAPLAARVAASVIDPATGLPAVAGRAAEALSAFARSHQRAEGTVDFAAGGLPGLLNQLNRYPAETRQGLESFVETQTRAGEKPEDIGAVLSDWLRDNPAPEMPAGAGYDQYGVAIDQPLSAAARAEKTAPATPAVSSAAAEASRFAEVAPGVYLPRRPATPPEAPTAPGAVTTTAPAGGMIDVTAQLGGKRPPMTPEQRALRATLRNAPPPSADRFDLLTEPPAAGQAPLAPEEVMQHLEMLDAQHTANEARLDVLENRLANPGKAAIERPSWAVGWTNNELEAAAKATGLNPYTVGWGDKLGPGELQQLRESNIKGTPGVGEASLTPAQMRAEVARLRVENAQLTAVEARVWANPNADYYKPDLSTADLPWEYPSNGDTAPAAARSASQVDTGATAPAGRAPSANAAAPTDVPGAQATAGLGQPRASLEPELGQAPRPGSPGTSALSPLGQAPVPGPVLPVPGQVQTPVPSATLPASLAKSNPRYAIGPNQFNLVFASDLDKALYIVAQKTPSKADAQFLEYLHGQFPGTSDAQLRAMGSDVRDGIKGLARTGDPSQPLRIPVSQTVSDAQLGRAPLPIGADAPAAATGQAPTPLSSIGGNEALGPGGPQRGQLGLGAEGDTTLPYGAPRPTGVQALGPSGPQRGQLQIDTALPVGGPRPTGNEAPLPGGRLPGQVDLPGVQGPTEIHPRIQQLLGEHPEYAQIAQDGLNDLQASGGNPAQVARFFGGVERSAGLPSGVDPAAWFRTLRNGSMAGGLQTMTHVALSIPIQTLWSLPREAIAATIRNQPEQIPAAAVGLWKGLTAATEASLQQLRYGITAADAAAGGGRAGVTSAQTALPPTIALRTDNPAMQLGANVLSGLVGTHGAAQTFNETLGFTQKATQLAWTQAKTEGLHGNAFSARVADIMGNLTDPANAAIATEAQAYGQRMALRGAQGDFGQLMQRVAAGGDSQVGKVAGNIILPFEAIAYNVATQGIEATPGLGALGLGIDKLAQFAGHGPYAAGASAAGRQPVTPFAERAANQLLGVGIAALGWELASQGIIRGAKPAGTPGITLTDQGVQYDGIQLGNVFVPGHVLGKLWYPLAAAANGYEIANQPGADTSQIAADSVRRTVDFAQNETWLRSFAALVGALTDKTGHQLKQFATSLGENVNPQNAMERDVGRITDPYERQAPTTGDFLDQVGGRIGAQLPGVRESYPIRQDRAGAPIPNPYQGLGILAPKSRAADPMLAMLDSYGVTLPAAPKTASTPNGRILDLTPAEAAQVERDAFNILRQRSSAQAADPDFQALTWAQQGALLNRDVTAARTIAERQLLASLDENELTQRLAGHQPTGRAPIPLPGAPVPTFTPTTGQAPLPTRRRIPVPAGR